MSQDAGGDSKHLPQSRRQGTALCLSGGGFRATLFHLGAVRRLHELGVLDEIDTITSVSGGSIFAAFLAKEFAGSPSITDYESQIAVPLREFTSREMRTWPAVRSHMLPWNWLRPNVGTRALERQYAERITRLSLSELPEKPEFVFCASDMLFMVNWEFKRQEVGDYQAGYLVPDATWTVAQAVAASSCFPPVFRAMRLRLKPSQLQRGRFKDAVQRQRLIPKLSLSDGGVYDNLGLEPVWKDHANVLVSDGGGTFAFEAPNWPHAQLLRYADVARDQALDLRKRWLISSFQIPRDAPVMEGAYWSIGTDIKGYHRGGVQPPGYSRELSKTLIAQIRTDLDRFSDAEQKILENQGYLLANAAVQRYSDRLVTRPSRELEIPHPEYWDNDEAVREALQDSHRRNWLGRR